MLKRCLNEKSPDYPTYGGRGITIYPRWIKSFENFIEDMGERPSKLYSIDRLDSSKGYFPGNCRWATWKEQMESRKKAHPPLPRLDLICRMCKTLYTRSLYDFKRYGEGFCSISCSASYRQIEKAARNGNRKQLVTCQFCGKDIWRTPYMISHRKTLTCSLECRDLLKKRQGAVSPTI